MAFENLVGNEKAKKLLASIIEQKKATHSYLFLGPSGIGKTLFAKEFAKMLLCMGQPKACGGCKSCIQFEENNQPDFIFIEPEEGKIKIEQIRRMQAKILEKPIISSKKVYLIKDADQMTKEAGNCLLKTLEEPPQFVTIILIASNESALLNTIRSRCMKVPFQKIERETLKQFLETKQGIRNVTKERLDAFDGSIEKALKIEEKKEVYDEIQKIFSEVENYTLLEVKPHLECLYSNKEIIYDLLDYINILLLKQAKTKSKYLSYIETIQQVKRNLKFNSNFDMSMDQILFKIWEE